MSFFDLALQLSKFLLLVSSFNYQCILELEVVRSNIQYLKASQEQHIPPAPTTWAGDQNVQVS